MNAKVNVPVAPAASAEQATIRQADWCAALLDPSLPAPAGLRVWNGVDPRSRLAVHRNNVVGGLVEVLAANFPVVRQLVGEAFFRALAAAYVRQWPPHSCVLAHYGAPATLPAPGGADSDSGFPAFIESFGPAASLPYLADMARLESARTRACHAADAVPLTAEAGAAALAAGEQAAHEQAAGEPVPAGAGLAAVAGLRLVCHPSLALIVSPHPVVSLWAAHQTDDEPALADIDLSCAEAALVLRRDLAVLVLPLPAAAAPGLSALLLALQRQARLADAAAQALAAQPDADLAGLLGLLVAQGGLCALDLPLV